MSERCVYGDEVAVQTLCRNGMRVYDSEDEEAWVAILRGSSASLQVEELI